MKATWKNSLIPCLWFTAVFPGKKRRFLSWEMAKEEPQDILGERENLRNSPNLWVLQVKSDGETVAWLLSRERLEFNLEILFFFL